MSRPEQLDMFRELEYAEAYDAWAKRVDHLRVCKVAPWWNSPPGCTCSTETETGPTQLLDTCVQNAT